MPEEEAFCVFVKLMQDYRLRELFKPSMAELGLCMYQFECMIQVSAESILCLLHIPNNAPSPGLPEHLFHICFSFLMFKDWESD